MSFDLKGNHSFDATPDELWQAMLDTDVLAACLPAVREITRVSEGEFHVVFSKRFGILPVTLPVIIQILQAQPPGSWRLQAQSQHKILGLANAGADISTHIGDERITRLDYVAFASVGEPVMKLLGSAFQQRIDGWVKDFFDKFQAEVVRRRAGI